MWPGCYNCPTNSPCHQCWVQTNVPSSQCPSTPHAQLAALSPATISTMLKHSSTCRSTVHHAYHALPAHHNTHTSGKGGSSTMVSAVGSCCRKVCVNSFCSAHSHESAKSKCLEAAGPGSGSASCATRPGGQPKAESCIITMSMPTGSGNKRPCSHVGCVGSYAWGSGCHALNAIPCMCTGGSS